METILFYLAVATLLFVVIVGIEAGLGNRSIGFLKDVVPSREVPRPKVSVIIPARNEEGKIKEALESLLEQDYESLEIIVLDDRSTDGTGVILKQMGLHDRRLRVLQIVELPPGWIGKNHALHYGAEQARGELLLFTDADIVMDRSTVMKTVSYMMEAQVDHLTLTPDIKMPGVALEVLVGVFSFFFGFFVRPWKVKNPKSGQFVGIGAFNLVRRGVYRAVGTHRAIAMRPDDDLKLGKLIKRNGYHQELLFGHEMLQVEWYSSVRELNRGLMKNMFAGVDYRISAVVGGTLLLLLGGVWPFVAVFVTDGITQILNLTIVFLIWGMCWDSARFSNVKPWFGLGFPMATLFFVYLQWKAMLTAFFTNGIDWRGTHYSLAELKANKV